MSVTGRLFQDDLPAPLGRRGKVHIGTSGYSFADWRGVFYPERLPRRDWLQFYARHFGVVEINATYYGLPSPATFAGMAERTPDKFGFWVKVPGDVTHRDGEVSGVMSAFMRAVRPLSEAEKLHGTLAQFPNSLRRSPEGIERILRIQDAQGDTPLAVEFRRDDWQSDEVYRQLESRGIISVTADLPDIPGLPHPEVRQTGHAAYIRFHGRNRRTWYNPEAGDRYDYEYSPEELQDWLPRIDALEERAHTAYIFFNNCHAGQAVKNARLLRQLLAFPDG